MGAGLNVFGPVEPGVRRGLGFKFKRLGNDQTVDAQATCESTLRGLRQRKRDRANARLFHSF